MSSTFLCDHGSERSGKRDKIIVIRVSTSFVVFVHNGCWKKKQWRGSEGRGGGTPWLCSTGVCVCVVIVGMSKIVEYYVCLPVGMSFSTLNGHDHYKTPPKSNNVDTVDLCGTPIQPS